MASGKNEVLGDRGVEPFQLRHPETGLRYRSGWNFSEKTVVIRIDFFEDGNGAGCSDEVNA